MAEALPVNFTIPAENVIASYNYSDVAEGTGVIVYYGARTAQGYILTTSTIYSNYVLTTSLNSTASSDTIQADVDFDVTFNSPQRIKGKVICQIPYAYRNHQGTTQNYATYVKCYVRKWDGSTETEIANATSDQIGDAATTFATTTGTTRQFMQTVSVNVATLQHFKIGESLRITVEYHGWSGGGNTDYWIGHDPQNRATDVYQTLNGTSNSFGSEPSNLIIHVPFRIDT